MHISTCNRRYCRELVVIDQLAESFGHLLDDDLFWVSSLKDKVCRLKLISSAESVRRILERFPSVDCQAFSDKSTIFHVLRWFRHIRYFTRLSVLANEKGKILFQSFHELSTLWFSLRNPGVEIYLVATNNLTGPGVGTGRRIFIQKILFRRVAGIFVGSEFERERLLRVHGVLPQRVHRLGYHKLGSRHHIIPLAQRKKEVAFLGVPSEVRGISTFINWARACSGSHYTFAVYSDFSLSSVRMIEILDETVPNLIVNNRYLSEEEYHDVIAGASFIALPFKKELEGRLSGILCDAIAHGTPVLATDQEPHKFLFSKYGDFGVLFQSSSGHLVRDVLARFEDGRWTDFQRSMRRIRDDNSSNNIAECVLGTIFEQR